MSIQALTMDDSNRWLQQRAVWLALAGTRSRRSPSVEICSGEPLVSQAGRGGARGSRAKKGAPQQKAQILRLIVAPPKMWTLRPTKLRMMNGSTCSSISRACERSNQSKGDAHSAALALQTKAPTQTTNHPNRQDGVSRRQCAKIGLLPLGDTTMHEKERWRADVFSPPPVFSLVWDACCLSRARSPTPPLNRSLSAAPNNHNRSRSRTLELSCPTSPPRHGPFGGSFGAGRGRSRPRQSPGAGAAEEMYAPMRPLKCGLGYSRPGQSCCGGCLCVDQSGLHDACGWDRACSRYFRGNRRLPFDDPLSFLAPHAHIRLHRTQGRGVRARV